MSGRSDPVAPSLTERREDSLDRVLIAVDLPGAARTIGIAVRPSRMAAAWLVWMIATLLVFALWLPLPGRRAWRRRLLLSASSVPPDRAPRTPRTRRPAWSRPGRPGERRSEATVPVAEAAGLLS